MDFAIVTVESSTIVNNAGTLGSNFQVCTFANCILRNNGPSEFLGVPPTVTYSNVKGGWPGTGNIDADPLFVNLAKGDLRLQTGSPCIDAGNSHRTVQQLIEFDLLGVSRLVDRPDVADTGISFMSLTVDMGPYEVQAEPVVETCPADIAPSPGGNGIVNVDDLLDIINAWGVCS